MGTVTIMKDTTTNPITLIGECMGPCYGSDTTKDKKNYRRGLEGINSKHGRVLEFPQIYLVLDGYSAKVIREFYTHIGGGPTRLQASTRYINYQNGFDFIVPPKIEANKEAYAEYMKAIKAVQKAMLALNDMGIEKEDSSGLLPLNYTTKVVVRCNLRMLIDMAAQRLCTRAYWEYRQLMRDIIKALSEYSPEWKTVCDNYLKCKCDISQCCYEKFSCGKYPKK